MVENLFGKWYFFGVRVFFYSLSNIKATKDFKVLKISNIHYNKNANKTKEKISLFKKIF